MTVIFALPGNNFSKPFFLNFLRFLNYMETTGIRYMVSMEGGSNVSATREKCLGIRDDAFDDVKALPFNGEVNYDYIMWIDSDILFDPQDFQKLLDRNVDIVAGCYKKDEKLYPMSKFGVPPGEDLLCLEEKDLQGKELIKAAGFGLGFTLIKKGVFESIERPWFETTMVSYAGKSHFVTEDIFFCLKAIDYGFDLWIDPTVKVKHLKPRLI